MRQRVIKSSIFAGILGVLAVAGIACGVSQDSFDTLNSDVTTLESSVNALEDRIEGLEATAQSLTPPGDGDTMTPTPPPSSGETSFVHGTFDNNDNIVANIRSGNTLFRIDQQQPLQGYGAVMALALQHRFGITPASQLTLTGPGLVELANVDSAPTRWWRDERMGEGNGLTMDEVRTQAGNLNFIAIQHAECAYDAFWCTVQEGIRQAQEDTGVDVDIRAPEANQEASDRLPQLIQTAIAEQPDGILLTYTFPDNAAFTAAVDAINQANIPVVAYNAGNGRQEDGDRYLTVYNQDEFEAGKQAATRLIAAAETDGLTPVGVCINHAVGNTSTDSRCRGFNEVFSADSDASVIGNGVLQTDLDPVGSASTISSYFEANPTANVFLTMGPGSATPFYTAIEDAGLDNFVHGTFDTSEQINENIQSGVTEFGIDQQPFLQGYAAVNTLYLNWLYNVAPVPGRSLTGPGFVTTDNIDDIPENVAGYRTARENEDIDIVFVHHGASTNAWWLTMNDTIRLAAANLGVNVDIQVPEIDENTDQVEDILTRVAASNADGYAVTISSRDDEGEAAPGYKTAINALLDIAPVVAFNAGNGPDADGVAYGTYIGQTEYQAGYLGGQRLAREVTSAGIENPLAICFNQTVGLANLDARCDGFTDAMEEAGIALAGNGVLNVTTNEADATNNMSTFFESNPGVNVFFTLGPQVANSFYNFLDEVGLSN